MNDNELSFNVNKCQRHIQIASFYGLKCGNIFDDYFQKEHASIDDLIRSKKDIIKIFNTKPCTINNPKIRAQKLCVFLHGWGAESSLYQDLCMSLCSDFDLVVAPDILGFGSSPDLKAVWKMDNFVCMLERLLELFDFDEITLAGHSFGGKIILFWLEKNQSVEAIEKVKNVILFSPSGVKPRFSFKKWIKVRRYKSIKKKCKNSPKLMKKLSKFGSNDYKNISSPFLKKTFVNVVGEHLDKSPLDISAKVLLIFGKCDRETPIFMGRKLKNKIRCSLLETIPRAGHYCFLDFPEEVNKIIHKFLSSP